MVGSQSDTHDKLLSAATEVFVEKGFSGARVDEIARRAGANKAMIYYHFGPKRALYQAVLLGLFARVLEEVERLGAVADPLERLRGFYARLVELFTEQPALPRLMAREIVGGGRSMETETAKTIAAIVRFVAAAVRAGVDQGRFRPVDPLLVHVTMIGVTMLFFAGEGFRSRHLSQVLPDLEPPQVEHLATHLTDTLTRMLLRDLSDPSVRR